MTTVFDAALSGFIATLTSLLPFSPEGEPFSSIVPGYHYLLVPSYLGVILALLFHFRDELSKSSFEIILGQYRPSLKFVIFATLFTILVGYPLRRFSCGVSSTISAALNALLGAVIVLYSIRPELNPLHRLCEKFDEEPSIVDSISGGVAQGFAVLGSLSRTGLTLSVLTMPSHGYRKALEWSLWIAPAYILLKLILLGPWQAKSSVWIPFSALLSAFVTSLLLARALLYLAERRGRELFSVIGLTAVVVYLMEVVL